MINAFHCQPSPIEGQMHIFVSCGLTPLNMPIPVFFLVSEVPSVDLHGNIVSRAIKRLKNLIAIKNIAI